MRIETPERDFACNGPRLGDQPLLLKFGGKFVLPMHANEEPKGADTAALDKKRSTLTKIAEDLNAGRYTEAAIRFVQARHLQPNLNYEVSKGGFNPDQPRNALGEWSSTGANGDALEGSDAVAVSDAYCKLVKQLCIVEATATLPTSDFGASFFKAMNSCMERHGCLGRA